MSRANTLIVVGSTLIVVLFALFATIHLWLPPTSDEDLGIGIIVISIFLLLHVSLAICLTVLTLEAAYRWKRSPTTRTSTDIGVLAVGFTVAVAAIAYTVYFFVF